MPANHKTSPVERRQHRRIGRDDRLFVQFGEVPGASELNGETRPCHSLDASPGGLCLRINEALPRNSTVELWVSIESLPSKYYLHGHVAWCAYKPGREKHDVGIVLHAARGTDLNAWATLFSH